MTKKRAQGLSAKLHGFFYDVGNRYFHIVNDLLAIVTILSVLVIILETVPSLEQYSLIFFCVEWSAVAIFSLEYVGRVIANGRNARRYIFSFFGIIDLLAILPSFIGVANLTFLKTARTLRIMRLLRMVRLAKMAKMPTHHDAEEQSSEFKLSLQIYFATLFSGIILFGTLMYLAEGYRAEFESIPLAMLWATKVTLGGVPQYMPATIWGEILTILIRFFGILLFGLLLSITGTALKKFLLGTK